MVMVMAVIRKAERRNCSEWLVVIKGKMAQFQVNTQKKDCGQQHVPQINNFVARLIGQRD